MNNYLFIDNFYKVAHNLLYLRESQNNKKWPNKNNDVITDLGGGGNFPMFLFTPLIYSTPTSDKRRGICVAARNSHPLSCAEWSVSA